VCVCQREGIKCVGGREKDKKRKREREKERKREREKDIKRERDGEGIK
jgi:hypothetical protein